MRCFTGSSLAPRRGLQSEVSEEEVTVEAAVSLSAWSRLHPLLRSSRYLHWTPGTTSNIAQIKTPSDRKWKWKLEVHVCLLSHMSANRKKNQKSPTRTLLCLWILSIFQWKPPQQLLKIQAVGESCSLRAVPISPDLHFNCGKSLNLAFGASDEFVPPVGWEVS